MYSSRDTFILFQKNNTAAAAAALSKSLAKKPNSNTTAAAAAAAAATEGGEEPHMYEVSGGITASEQKRARVCPFSRLWTASVV